jgi:hypothetical protein
MFDGECISQLVLRRVNCIKTLKSSEMQDLGPVESRSVPQLFSTAGLAENAHAVQKTTRSHA